MSLAGVALVPAAPLLVVGTPPTRPAAASDAIGALRADVGEVLAQQPGADTALLLASGSQPLVHDARSATLASYGYPATSAPIETDTTLLEEIAGRGQAPRVQASRLDGDLAVLALLLAAARPDLRLAAVTVPAGADAAALDGVATGLSAAIAAARERITVVAAADLAATLEASSPGYLVQGAGEWDAAAYAAVLAQDVEGFAQLGPGAAQHVQARGWAPIYVALSIAAGGGVDLGRTAYHAPRGVGQLVAG